MLHFLKCRFQYLLPPFLVFLIVIHLVLMVLGFVDPEVIGGRYTEYMFILMTLLIGACLIDEELFLGQKVINLVGILPISPRDLARATAVYIYVKAGVLLLPSTLTLLVLYSDNAGTLLQTIVTLYLAITSCSLVYVGLRRTQKMDGAVREGVGSMLYLGITLLLIFLYQDGPVHQSGFLPSTLLCFFIGNGVLCTSFLSVTGHCPMTSR